LYERIIKVAATDENDCVASFSNFGSWVTLAAPGVGIYSCYHNHSDPETDYVASFDGTMNVCNSFGCKRGSFDMVRKTPAQSADVVKSRLVRSADSIDGLSCNSAYPEELDRAELTAYRAVTGTISQASDLGKQL